MAPPSPSQATETSPRPSPSPTGKQQAPTSSTPTPADPGPTTGPLPRFRRQPDEDQSPTPSPLGNGAGSAAGSDVPPAPADIPGSPTDEPGLLEPSGARSRFAGRLRLLKGRVNEDTKAALFKVAAGMLTQIGAVIQARSVPPSVFGPNDVWLMDADDLDAIAGSLASLAARRSPAGLTGDSDAADLIGLAFGTGAYAVKNYPRAAQARALLAAGAWSPLEQQPRVDLFKPGAAEPAVSPAAGNLANGLGADHG